MPDLYPDNPVQCEHCGSNFALTPGGDLQGAACPECGGKRMFFNQPSPVESEGTLRNMVDSDTQKDEGGNPLGEGTIVGDDGIVPYSTGSGRGRDDGTYSHDILAALVESDYPSMGYEQSDIPQDMGLQAWRRAPDHQSVCPLCQEPVTDPRGHGYSYHVMEKHPEFANAMNPVASVTEQVKMLRELNTEPYMPWTHEASTHTAGPAVAIPAAEAEVAALPAEAAGVAAAGGAIADAAGAVGGAAESAGSGLINGAKGLIGGLFGGGGASKVVPSLMKGALKSGISGVAKGVGEGLIGGGGQQAGGESPEPVTQAPSMMSYGSADIPMILLADLETPDSVDSVDEQEDDPHDQDQKEFSDGDHSPSNHQNPNNEDSGQNGEDGARDATPGYGIGDNSPGLERLEMVLPLLLHYFDSEESGLQDPIIKALHETFEKESPGYLDNEHPDGHGMVQLLVQHHKSPRGVHAGVGFPSGLPPVPTTPQEAAQPAQGAPANCPSCGGPMVNGACPTCGQGFGQGQPQMAAPGAPSMPPMTANHVGPVTPEQIEAVAQLLISQGRSGEVEIMKQNPQLYQQELGEITQNPQPSAPLVDPSQATPPSPMEGAPGAAPMPMPGGPGAGGQPMMPMSKFDEHIAFWKDADANAQSPRCPKCNTASTETSTGADGSTWAQCHTPGCHHTWELKDMIQEQKTSRAVWAELANPTTLDAAGQNSPVDRQHTHDPSMQWVDNTGAELMAGQTYELYSPAFSVPDIIRILDVKPDEISVQLVGQYSNPNDSQSGVFPISRQEAQLDKYEFVSYDGGDQSAESTEPPTGGSTTPGLDQPPPQETTDMRQDSYPSTHVTHVSDDVCMRCSSTDVYHEMSSPTRTMHQCFGCDHAWESEEHDEGHTAGVDLGWLMDDSNPLDFQSERMEAMERASSGSRSLSDIASKDARLQAIKQRLDANPKVTDKLAGRQFTHGERRELIDETGRARNLGDLDLSNTHYDTRIDYTGKANEMNVPDEHLALGL